MPLLGDRGPSYRRRSSREIIGRPELCAQLGAILTVARSNPPRDGPNCRLTQGLERSGRAAANPLEGDHVLGRGAEENTSASTHTCPQLLTHTPCPVMSVGLGKR